MAPPPASALVRPVRRTDAAAWLAMRRELWPGGSETEHAEEIEEFFSGRAREPLAVLIAEDPEGNAVGFVELSIRPSAHECRTDRVGFLEGWFVAPEARRRSVGRHLVAAAEDWARSQGCSELASDSEAGNTASAKAHAAAGFADVGLVRCYRKDL
ncbi:MAG TPA: GNAT family N-acetyltransferase [Thermoanaerobaculia bacterium]